MKDEIKLEDLQEQHRRYAEIIGVENMIALAQTCGGTQIYIPQVDELIKNRKYRAISEDYKKGTTIKELASKYRVSESTVYRLVREQIIQKKNEQKLQKKKQEKQKENIPGQIDLMTYLRGE